MVHSRQADSEGDCVEARCCAGGGAVAVTARAACDGDDEQRDACDGLRHGVSLSHDAVTIGTNAGLSRRAMSSALPLLPLQRSATVGSKSVTASTLFFQIA
jgi:hypothetical protein